MRSSEGLQAGILMPRAERVQRGTDELARSFRRERLGHWSWVACKYGSSRGAGRFYHQILERHYRFLVPPGQRVLEVGCGEGDLLAAVEPSFGVGVDFSEEMILRASKKHPSLRFVLADAHELSFRGHFDVIILSDLVNDVWDVQTVFEQVRRLAHRRTRLVLNTYTLVWEIPLLVSQRLGLTRPNLEQNWLTVADVSNLLKLTGFDVIYHRQEILLPLHIPLISVLANRFLVKLWPFSLAALTNFVIARPAVQPENEQVNHKPTVSITVPARNEAGNIEGVLRRTPEMGGGTEIIFVEGHSSDGTYQAIQEAIARYPGRRCRLLKQSPRGKGDAVRKGFASSRGDILMILDADLAVPPEQLPRFYDALVSGRAEFVNGVRLVYPVEKQAMRFLNLLGNKFFSVAFSWLLGQPLKDTLCGTKALWKSDYQLIEANRAYFGDFDPFGDFDLLFGAAKLNLKIVDMPIRYRQRVYGSTNIDRWRHGWLLLRMTAFAAKRLKFV